MAPERVVAPSRERMCALAKAYLHAVATYDATRSEADWAAYLAANAAFRAAQEQQQRADAQMSLVDVARAVVADEDRNESLRAEGRRAGLLEAAAYAEARRAQRKARADVSVPPHRKLWLAFALEAVVIRNNLRRFAARPDHPDPS